ncbi:MAG TPA: CPBP family intramembrane glutamic endopeptidase [Actinomycetota bacterium]|nr:CPBP family intramembrane glutamic endopeptidase [Actinomycetota bacterium]
MRSDGRPPRRASASPGRREALAAVAVVAATNVVLNRVAPRPAVVPTALAGAGAVMSLARRGGVGWPEMGLAPSSLRAGLRWGALASIPVVAGGIGAAVVPGARRLLADRRVVESSPADLVYHLALRIPLATALAEELIFRGALRPLLRRRRSRAVGELLTASLFGLWHVLPTLEQLETHPERRAAAGREWLVLGSAVGVTAAGSLAFGWLRDRSGSLIAPVIAHAAANASSFAAGWAGRVSASRRRGPAGRRPDRPPTAAATPPRPRA